MMESQNKEMASVGHQIYNLLDGLNPVEKKHALREAEERILAMYKDEITEAEKSLDSIRQQLHDFENGGIN